MLQEPLNRDAVIRIGGYLIMSGFGFTALFFISDITGSIKNMDAVEEEMAKNDRLYDLLIYGLLPVQFAIMAYFLFRIGA